MFFKNSRRTYALHLMNSLLNIFCYIISNVSIRKNLHMVWLMTQSYPDQHRLLQEAMSPTYTRGMTRFAQSIWGNQVKIRRISQMPKSQRHASQAEVKLFPGQSGEIKSRFRESLKDAKNNQGHASK